MGGRIKHFRSQLMRPNGANVIIGDGLFNIPEDYEPSQSLTYDLSDNVVGVAYDKRYYEEGTPFVAYMTNERGGIKAIVKHKSFREALINARMIYKGKLAFENARRVKAERKKGQDSNEQSTPTIRIHGRPDQDLKRKENDAENGAIIRPNGRDLVLLEAVDGAKYVFTVAARSITKGDTVKYTGTIHSFDEKRVGRNPLTSIRKACELIIEAKNSNNAVLKVLRENTIPVVMVGVIGRESAYGGVLKFRGVAKMKRKNVDGSMLKPHSRLGRKKRKK